MWDYSDKVREHFFNPRNAGALDGANGVGDVGSIKCGDALRLMLKVHPESEVILDASFQTFGCGSAIASSSALTEIIKGKTLDEALRVTNQDIADYLDGLPPEKMHCSVMGREALQAAVANYRGELWSDGHDEGTLICKCFAVDATLIEEVVRGNALTTVEQVTHYTKAGGSCCSCHEGIEEILAKICAETPTHSHHAAPSCTTQGPSVKPASASPASAAVMTNYQRIRRIEATLEEIRPQLQRDHGDMELVEIQGKKIYLNLVGACAGCMMEQATMGGIQAKLCEALGELVQVLPARELAKALAGA